MEGCRWGTHVAIQKGSLAFLFLQPLRVIFLVSDLLYDSTPFKTLIRMSMKREKGHVWVSGSLKRENSVHGCASPSHWPSSLFSCNANFAPTPKVCHVHYECPYIAFTTSFSSWFLRTKEMGSVRESRDWKKGQSRSGLQPWNDPGSGVTHWKFSLVRFFFGFSAIFLT